MPQFRRALASILVGLAALSLAYFILEWLAAPDLLTVVCCLLVGILTAVAMDDLLKR